MRWLKSIIRKRASRVSSEELDYFLAVLEGMTNEEISFLIVSNTIVRIGMQIQNGFDETVFSKCANKEQQEILEWQIQHKIRKFQKLGQPTKAAQLMIWIHSLRAQRYIELRYKGKMLWQILKERGFDGIEQAMVEANSLMIDGVSITVKDCKYIPQGLEPNN